MMGKWGSYNAVGKPGKPLPAETFATLRERIHEVSEVISRQSAGSHHDLRARAQEVSSLLHGVPWRSSPSSSRVGGGRSSVPRFPLRPRAGPHSSETSKRSLVTESDEDESRSTYAVMSRVERASRAESSTRRHNKIARS